ncbi:hypothetical protein D3C78_1440680 [compost metagenome]
MQRPAHFMCGAHAFQDAAEQPLFEACIELTLVVGLFQHVLRKADTEKRRAIVAAFIIVRQRLGIDFCARGKGLVGNLPTDSGLSVIQFEEFASIGADVLDHHDQLNTTMAICCGATGLTLGRSKGTGFGQRPVEVGIGEGCTVEVTAAQVCAVERNIVQLGFREVCAAQVGQTKARPVQVGVAK